MSAETLLLEFPRVLTPRRLARRLAAPTALAVIATGLALAGIFTTNRAAGAAAIAWAAGAILLMRPDHERLDAIVDEADRRFRRFLSRRSDIVGRRSARDLLATLNPTDVPHGWTALVAMGLPRGGWTLLAVPSLLASTALVTGATVLLAPLASSGGALLLVIVTGLAILLGLDAYASTVRSTLDAYAVEASESLRTTIVIAATVEDALERLVDPTTGLPHAGDLPELGSDRADR